jgi:hypothetical protein
MKPETLKAIRAFSVAVKDTILTVRNYGGEADVRHMLNMQESLENALRDEPTEYAKTVDARVDNLDSRMHDLERKMDLIARGQVF